MGFVPRPPTPSVKVKEKNSGRSSRIAKKIGFSKPESELHWTETLQPLRKSYAFVSVGDFQVDYSEKIKILDTMSRWRGEGTCFFNFILCLVYVHSGE